MVLNPRLLVMASEPPVGDVGRNEDEAASMLSNKAEDTVSSVLD